MTTCAHADCKEKGDFPAPRDPRNIGARQFFCQTHIKEFNKKWNGMKGFSEDEIFSMQNGAATWNRPTWAMGINSKSNKTAQFDFETAEDLYRFFRDRQVNEAKVLHKKEPSKKYLPPDVKEACAILALDKPIGGKILKKRYLNLIKKHHPDKNEGAEKAEETMKQINVAYKILEDFTTKKVNPFSV